MKQATFHRAFQISVVLKGAHALLEVVGGVALWFVSSATIGALVNALTQEELVEDPRDVVANALLRAAQDWSVQSQHFYAFYLLSHGVVKLALVAGLLRNKLWAYPASIAVLLGFIAYQLYRYSYTHGLGLLGLTVLDVVVIGLVWHEWRVVRTALPPPRPSPASGSGDS